MDIAHPWVFDWLDFGADNVEPNKLPRVSEYTEDKIKKLIYLLREYPTQFRV